MLTETITIHSGNGSIVWQYVTNAIVSDIRQFIGTMPWEWVLPEDRVAVKNAIGLAILDQSDGPVRYHLDPASFPGGLWTVETRWVRLPSNDMPILGISRTFNAVVENLSPREREIARLLPSHPVKQIAKKLDISPSTVDTLRRRLAEKLKISGNQLVAWCQAHHDIF